MSKQIKTLNRNIESFISCGSEYKNADIVLFGAPFDSTTSFRPGARFASKAIRSESFGIETYSPYLDRDLIDIKVFDGGDIELPFGSTKKALQMIEKYVDKVLDDAKIPFMIGGEHLVTFGALNAVFKKYPDLHIVHFDAHTDLRDSYLGEKLSHSAVIRRAWELVGDKKIHQFGIRSGERYEFEFARLHNILHMFNTDGLKEMVHELKGKPVYFTLDLDILDPSIFPGTGTPEAGGIFYQELQNAIMIMKDLNIIACDVTELSPVYDQSGVSTAVACKAIREILLTL